MNERTCDGWQENLLDIFPDEPLTDSEMVDRIDEMGTITHLDIGDDREYGVLVDGDDDIFWFKGEWLDPEES